MPTTLEALLIVALVLTPGFIFTQIVRRTVAYVAESTDARFFLMIISSGMVIHALLVWWSSRILDFHIAKTLPANRWEVFAWAVVTIFVTPAALGIAIGLLSKVKRTDAVLEKLGMGYNDRMPSAWEFVIRKRFPAYVKVYLRDGKGIVAGVYQNKSFGSYPPGKPDIYLERQWQLDGDGNFHIPIPDSRGVWVSQDVIAYIEFQDKEVSNDAQEAVAAEDRSPPARGQERHVTDRQG